VTHPIQYYAPWYRGLAAAVDLEVFFSHRQTSAGQAAAGYGVEFEWDVPLLDGYAHTFLTNRARQPSVEQFWGCDTPEIADVIRRRKFDAFIVHGWSTLSYCQAILACWRTGTPVLVRGDSNLDTPRAWWWRAMKWPIFRAAISRFDGYLVVGSAARNYVLHYGADPARCFDAPHGVDNAFFRTRSDALASERAQLRASFDLDPGAVVFLFAGRFIDRKRPGLFVDAIAEVARRVPDAVGLMVGDGPLRQATEARAREAGAPVRFSGFLNQTAMVRAYTAADVLVVPSTWETWGLVVNEAMACGLPAVVTDRVACAGDLVLPGQTGEVVPIDNLGELTARLERLAADRAYRQQLAAGARNHVERFDLSAAVAGTVRALESIARPRRPRQDEDWSRPASISRTAL
jgi:glycosyltransferase involved in cell wall biosynthesis